MAGGNQKFTLTFDAQLNVGQMKGAIGNIQNELNRLQLPQNLTKGIGTTLTNLEKEVRNFEVAAGKDLSDKGNFSALERSAQKIDTLFKDLQIQARDLGSNVDLDKFFPTNIVTTINKAKQALSDYQASLKKLNEAEANAQKKVNTAQNRQTVAQGNLDAAKQELQQFKSEYEATLNEMFAKAKMSPENIFDAEAIDQALQKIAELQKRYQEIQNNVGPGGKKYNYAESTKQGAQQSEQELENLINKYRQLGEAIPGAEAQVKKLETAYTNATNRVKEMQLALEQAKQASEGGQADAIKKLFEQLNAAGVDTTGLEQNFANAEAALNKYAETARGEVVSAITSLNNTINQNSGAVERNTQDVNNNAQAYSNFDARMRDVSAFKSRIQYFFGLNNAINLFKRAIREAFNTIKDLDKAMTETAVVTDFTVSDMWKQLPEYTKRANELGVTTQAAYESATLFYQQGLNTKQAAELSTETLKMARIAGLDAAEATDRMTNALRGFNMELDAVSAQRVDDVYSQLAAHSASNVDEISTAMTKVASLAKSANMEFETTAAFLAQIIETTRESAETAGTALKTVVARFSEVKKLYSEDQLKGTDEEGQVIDVNKIGTALRTAGIDLNKYFLGEVGLDDIFMELASKWDSLTSVQQRYIATQAAGSRQQSRFIALMQDYARTQELVGLAYDSNGASAKQFEKTQDSLQSKLARLKNAWNEFLMGLTNSVVVKTAVDLLTDLLNLVNKITSAFGNGAGSVLKWVAAIGAIQGVGKLFKTGGFLDNILMSAVGKTTIGKGLINASSVGSPLTQSPTPATIDRSPTWNGNQWVAAPRRGGLFANIGQRFSARQEAFDEVTRQGTGKLSPDAGLLGNLGHKLASKGVGTKFAAKGGGAKLASLLGFGTKGLGAAGATGGGVAAGGTAAGAGASAAAALSVALIWVAAAAAAAATAYAIWLNASEQGQLIQAQRYAEAMGKTAENATKAADSLKDAEKSYKDYNKAVEDATTVSERKDAIQKRNESVQQLIEQNKDLAQYAHATQIEGQLVLTLDEKGLEEGIKKAEEGAAQAQASLNLANALQSGQQADVYASQLKHRAGINIEEGTITRYLADGQVKTEQMTEADYLKNAELINKYNAARMAEENYAQQGYAQTLINSGFEDDLANTVSAAMAKSFDEDEYLDAIKNQRFQNWNNSNASKKDLQKQYYELFGTQADPNMKRKELARAVAEAQVDKQYTESANDLARKIQLDSTGNLKTLLEAYNGKDVFNGANLLTATSEEDIYKAMGFDLSNEDTVNTIGKQLAELADVMGIEVKDLQKQIKEQAALRKKQQGKKLYETATNMAQANISSENMVKFLGLESFEQQELFNNIFSSFDSSAISDDLISNILTGIDEGDTALTDWLSSIDLSNPVESFTELSDAAENGKGRIQEVAQALLNAGNSSQQFSASSQLSFFTLSEEYESLTTDLDKFIDANGEISSSNILELANSSKTLKTLLDNDTMSAKALAVALTGIQKGTITMLDLSDAVIAALNNMDDLDGVVQKLIEDLNNFDPGYDENDVTGFINKVLDNANENIEKGAWGNNVMGNYMSKIFGEFEYDSTTMGGDYGEAYKAWLQSNVNWLNANKENMFSAWSDLSATLDNGMLGVAEVYERDGEIIINANGMTTDQLIQAMVDTGQVTKTQAEMMIADYKNYSADFAHEMAENDLPNTIQAWMDSLPTINGKKVYDENDLSTLSTLLGKEESEIRAIIDRLKTDNEEYQGIKWTNEDGEKTTETVRDVWQDLGVNLKSGTAGYNGSTFEDNTLFDYDKVKQAYSDLGLPQLFESDFQTILGDSKEFYAKLFGSDEPTKISIGEGETAGEAYARAYQEAVNQNLADKIGEQFQSAFDGLEITIDTENGIIAVKDLKEAVDDAEASADTISSETYTVTVDTSTAVSNCEALKKAADDAAAAIAAMNSAGGEGTGGAGGGTVATGGLVGSYANGSENRHISPGLALTGEEGPEIVWNKEKGYSYITGQHHPEFRDLRPGDRVFNAQETRQILRGSDAKGGIVPSLARGYGDAKKDKDKSGGGSGSGSGSGDNDEWKNDLDWLYNLMENIVELERQQNFLEEEYEDLLTDQTKTGQDLYKMLIKQLGNLYAQLDHQTFALEKREQEMREFMDTTNDQDQYLWYNWEDRTLEIDWDAIDLITDKDLYGHVKDLISEAESIQDKMDDAEDAIVDINNSIQELENIWRDTFVDFEERVLKAIIQSYQKVIDNYSELNDTLNESNQSIIDALNKEISLQRQIRDNTKTEEEISDNEARLAFLRRDTSGGNDLAALQLEKELNDQRENYTDNLIDQAIQKLQDDNDAAAQQREKQIELMQSQLDYQGENGYFNEYIKDLLTEAMGADGELLTNSDLMTLLKEADNWEAMSETAKQVWMEDLTNTYKEVAAWMIEEQNKAEGTYFTAVTAAFNNVSDTFNKSLIGSYSQGSTHGSSGSSKSGGNGQTPGKKPVDKPEYETTYTFSLGGTTYTSKVSAEDAVKQAAIKEGKRTGGYGTTGELASKIQSNPAAYVKNVVKEKKVKPKKKQATGGLNVKTGLAWLDGSIQEPEYVLSARQTDAFLRLADVLPAAMGMDGSSVANSFGSNVFNVSVNVDRIDSDYSVDQMVDRIKDKLYESASYRNVNALNFLR